MAKADRPEKDEYFMSIAYLVAERSTCTRRKVGAVIVKDGHILTTGYNGVPSGMPHCDQLGCLREDLNVPSGERHELCLGIHAEQNALLQAAKFGISVDGGTIYITNRPCSVCARMIANSGIRRVVYSEHYPDALSDFILRMCNIQVDILPYGNEGDNH